MTRRTVLPVWAAVAALGLAGCSMGTDDPVAADPTVVEGPADAEGAGGSELTVTSGEPPRSEVSALPADPGSEVVVTDELPLTVLRDGAVAAETSVEVRVAELLGGLDTRDSTGGETVVVLAEAILFDFDQAELRDAAGPTLAQVAELVGLSEDDSVRVVGHTDSNGSDEYNADLSLRRADAVVQALVAAGVDAARLQPEGRGESEPVAENTTADGSDNPDGRAANRRVEVLIDDLPGRD